MHGQGHGQAESKEYYELKDLVMEEVEPRNLTEVFLARDIGDAEWEISPLRGLKPGVIHAMIAGDPHARQALESMLAEHHLTVDIIGAATFGTRSGHRFTSTEWWQQLMTLDLGVVMAALVEAGLGSSYTSEWSCEERKTAEIRFSAKLSWERAVLTAVGQAWGQEVRQKAGRGRTALGAPWPEI
jgi:hypothetical protein